MRVPDAADRDVAASAFVVDNDRVLLARHAKLGAWLQPGGHVEARETTDEAATRAVREETGVEMRICEETGVEMRICEEFRPSPRHAESGRGHSAAVPRQLHPVQDGHWHCDFAFLGDVDGRGRPLTPEEHDGQRWVSREELPGLSAIVGVAWVGDGFASPGGSRCRHPSHSRASSPYTSRSSYAPST